MKKALYLACCLTLGLCASASNMPATSIMSEGNWTKIRVMSDGVYQLTYDELKQLGYSDPAAVKVFGYAPSLLVSCSFNVIPGDLKPIHTVNIPEQQKIVFYLADNYDFNPEAWRTKFTANDAAKRLRHINSIGATYFISDVHSGPASFSTIAAPKSTDGALTSHKAVYYHEDDATSLTEAGTIFLEPATITKTNGVTHPFTVSHLASPDATLLFGAYMAPSNTDVANTMVAYFSEGIENISSDGSKPNLLLQKEVLTPEFRSQEFTMPMTTESQTHTVTFKIPENGNQQKPCALDFFFVKYNRSNNVGVRPQSMMYFLNETKAATFELSGIDNKNWKVWNVTNPAEIKEIALNQSDDKFYGTLPAVASGYANEVVAFDVTAEQPSPEIIGHVANQNLHSMQVPDMLIVTSTPLLNSAYQIADFHERVQGLEVAVVDQAKIFNEYGSGNTSPEAVRRFVTHLNERNGSKLRGVLLLGPATFNNKDLVGDNMPYVVTAQCEEPSLARNITTNYSSDVYFVSAGEPKTSNPWLERHSTFCVFSNPPIAGVGRLPFKDASEINDYYKKAEYYLTNLPTYPALGNIIVASDYSTPTEKSRTHMSDGEQMLEAMNTEKHGTTITINRCASNLFSADNNVITRKIQNSTLARGAQFYAFFGHGTATGISGSTTARDPMLNLQSSLDVKGPAHTPFMYFASCHVAAVDIYTKTLSGNLLSNPNGGPVGVIGSGREVFPENNTELGREIAYCMDVAENNTPFGKVWCDAVWRFNDRMASYRKSICNTLNYNYIGDPMMPVYSATNAVEIDPIANNSMSFIAPTTISGRVTDLNGNFDSNFNGTVVLTIYDTPEEKANVNKTNPSNNPGYIASMEIDQEIIGQITADVKNGRFSVDAIAPSTSNPANHRIQAYVYSTDATNRGLGYVKGIDFVEAGTAASTTNQPVFIESFEVAISEASASHKHKATLTATIESPAGIAYSNALVNPVKLTIDGKAQDNVSNLVTPIGNGKFRMNYTTSQLEFGNHEANLAVLDADDNWAEETLYFMIDNTPEATLSAAVEEGTVNFEIATEINSATHRLIVENLHGDLVLNEVFTGPAYTANLNAGAYRAFVQVRSNSAASATQKVQFVVH